MLLSNRIGRFCAIFEKKEKEIKQREKFNYGHRHNVRNLPQFKNDSNVFINNGYFIGWALKSTDQPRSYVVDIPDRSSVVRNRKFLKPCIKNSADHFLETSTKQNGDAETNKDEASSYVTRSGRMSKLP